MFLIDEWPRLLYLKAGDFIFYRPSYTSGTIKGSYFLVMFLFAEHKAFIMVKQGLCKLLSKKTLCLDSASIKVSVETIMWSLKGCVMLVRRNRYAETIFAHLESTCLEQTRQKVMNVTLVKQRAM